MWELGSGEGWGLGHAVSRLRGFGEPLLQDLWRRQGGEAADLRIPVNAVSLRSGRRLLEMSAAEGTVERIPGFRVLSLPNASIAASTTENIAER